MTGTIGIVDLFSGPGGLAEGFSSFRSVDGQAPYSLEVSVEKERSAHATLILRSFLRKFPNGFPPEYHEFLNGERTVEPDWRKLYHIEWSLAVAETHCMELGRPETGKFLEERIRRIHATYGSRTVLIGGPPCQAYSLAGRSRNAGNVDYIPHRDERNFLYQEYVKVVGLLKPAAFVMENVKGMLSSAVKGGGIFQRVMADLRRPEDADVEYVLVALAPRSGSIEGVSGPAPREFVVRAEQHGVPQARHRVIIVGIRSDIAAFVGTDHLPCIQKQEAMVHVRHVLSGMPRLRSGLSRNDDVDSWSDSVHEATDMIVRNPPNLGEQELRAFQESIAVARDSACNRKLMERSSGSGSTLPNDCPAHLRDWLCDPRLSRLPNNGTRGHAASDLARYLFASAFGDATGRSPRSSEFPSALEPNHRNWKSGKFVDRFRVQVWNRPSSTVTSHISKDGHYYIHPDCTQCRSLTVREAARLQTFPDNYFFKGNRTQQYIQVGNAVPPYLARQIAGALWSSLEIWMRQDASIMPVHASGETKANDD